MATTKPRTEGGEHRRPRFDNSHFRPDVLYHKALMGRYPSAKNAQYRADELRYWHDRMVAAGLDPRDVERRCPYRVRAEAEAVTRSPSHAAD